MQIISSVQQMQQLALQWRGEGKKIALVPTMGALHEGHLSLVDVAKKNADRIVMSIFVNPTQFSLHEDLKKYPRPFDQDCNLAKSRGVDMLFVPAAEEIYPTHYQTYVVVTELTRGLCGAFRPGHFKGVTTIVAKLFLMTQAHVAIFGEKDYQQLKVIQRMVRDLCLPIKIISIPTLRENNGLALSSRNVYLSSEEKKEALLLYLSIQLAQRLVREGIFESKEILEQVQQYLAQGNHIQVQYAEIVDAENLEPLTQVDRPARILLAVLINGKRLIDNGPL